METRKYSVKVKAASPKVAQWLKANVCVQEQSVFGSPWQVGMKHDGSINSRIKFGTELPALITMAFLQFADKLKVGFDGVLTIHPTDLSKIKLVGKHNPDLLHAGHEAAGGGGDSDAEAVASELLS